MHTLTLMSTLYELLYFDGFRYADRAKQIVCKAVVNEDPKAKVRIWCIILYLIQHSLKVDKDGGTDSCGYLAKTVLYTHTLT